MNTDIEELNIKALFRQSKRVKLDAPARVLTGVLKGYENFLEQQEGSNKRKWALPAGLQWLTMSLVLAGTGYIVSKHIPQDFFQKTLPKSTSAPESMRSARPQIPTSPLAASSASSSSVSSRNRDSSQNPELETTHNKTQNLLPFVILEKKNMYAQSSTRPKEYNSRSAKGSPPRAANLASTAKIDANVTPSPSPAISVEQSVPSVIIVPTATSVPTNRPDPTPSSSTSPTALEIPKNVHARYVDNKEKADWVEDVDVNAYHYYYVWWDKPTNPNLKAIIYFRSNAPSVQAYSVVTEFNDHAIVPWQVKAQIYGMAWFTVKFQTNDKPSQVSSGSHEFALCVGDLDGDSVRNLNDYNLVLGFMTSCSGSPCSYQHLPTTSWPKEDLDGDGVVDGADLNISDYWSAISLGRSCNR